MGGELVSGPDSAVYDVFARLRPAEPLAHVGSVRAPSDVLARAYARTTYDEDRWIQMIAVPRTCVIPVIEPEER